MTNRRIEFDVRYHEATISDFAMAMRSGKQTLPQALRVLVTDVEIRVTGYNRDCLVLKVHGRIRLKFPPSGATTRSMGSISSSILVSVRG